MKVRAAEGEYLSAEALALAQALPPGSDLRASCAAVAEAVGGGEVPPDLEDAAGEVLTLALETGRARAVHGPAGERALAMLWRETPQGREAVEGASELTQALTALQGLEVVSVRITATAPSTFALAIAAGDSEVHVAFERGSVRLRSVNVGGGGAGE